MNTKTKSHMLKLLAKKGQIVTVTTRRMLRLKTGHTKKIYKVSTFQAQAGVVYDHKKEVIRKRRTGELPPENAGLPWGKWLVFPYVLSHYGDMYFRFYSLKNNFPGSAKYFSGKKEVTREEIEDLCRASEFQPNTQECFNVNLKHIVKIK